MKIPAHVMRSFLAPMLAVCGEPVSPEPEQFLEVYGRMLRGYCAEELAAAVDIVLRQHKGQARWPKIGECLDACESVREAMAARSAKPADAPSWQQQTAQAEAFIASCEMGRRAAAEHWALGLREFVMGKRRLPNEYEIVRLRETEDFVTRCADGRIQMGLVHDALMRLANQLVDRREAISQRLTT